MGSNANLPKSRAPTFLHGTIDTAMKKGQKKSSITSIRLRGHHKRARTNEERWTYLQIASGERDRAERAGDHEAPDLIEARGGRAALRSIPDDDDDALA